MDGGHQPRSSIRRATWRTEGRTQDGSGQPETNTGRRACGASTFYIDIRYRARNTCPRKIWSVAQRKLDYLKDAEALTDLRVPPGNRLESLAGDREGEHSIRISDQYGICAFRRTGRRRTPARCC